MPPLTSLKLTSQCVLSSSVCLAHVGGCGGFIFYELFPSFRCPIQFWKAIYKFSEPYISSCTIPLLLCLF